MQAKARSGERQPVRSFKDDSRTRQRGDHQPVPVSEDLVVPARTDARGSAGEKLRTHPGKASFLHLGQQRLRVETIENRVAFEISVGGDGVNAGENGRILGA